MPWRSAWAEVAAGLATSGRRAATNEKPDESVLSDWGITEG